MRSQLASGEPVPPLEERFVRRDGSTFVGEAVAAPVTWHGEPAIHVIVRDVTDIRAAQEQLRRSEQRYRELFEISPEPMTVHDGRTILQANRAAGRYFGLPVEEAVGTEIWDYVLEPEPEIFAPRLQAMLDTTRPAPAMEITLRAADGTQLEAELTSAPTWWEGNPVIVSVFHDLTEHKRAEEALRQSELRFSAIVENASVGIHLFRLEDDARLVLIAANEAADRVLGVPNAGWLGRPIEEVLPDLLNGDLPDRLREVARAGAHLEMERVDYDDGVIRGTFELNCFQTSQDYVCVMFNNITERITTELELERYRDNLEQLVAERTRELEQAQRGIDAIASVAARAVELRDPYTAGHQRRVAQLVAAMTTHLGYSDEECEHIRVAAQLHDIGKLSIPAEILSKPGKLLAVEYELVKGHAWAAYEILADVDIGWPLAEMVAQHHERMDGSGYPRGLVGDEIMVQARMLAVADVVEAMSSHRPYRPSIGREEAIAEIIEHRGTLYDAEMVDVCVALMREGFEFEDD